MSSEQPREFIFGSEPTPDPVESAKKALREAEILNWKSDKLENGAEVITFDAPPTGEAISILNTAGFRIRSREINP